MIQEKIRSLIEKAEIKRGDLIYVSSDITFLPLMLKKNGCRLSVDHVLNEIVDQLQSVVSEEGTVVFPLFSWAFCRGETFDCRNTPGEVGAFSNWVFRNRSDFARTRHPIYSFLIWGKCKEDLVNIDNQESWGIDSPFQYMYDRGAKQILLGCTLQRGFTFVHYIEQKLRVPYRHHKIFVGGYIDQNGKRTIRAYSMYVRDLDQKIKGYLPDSILREEGMATDGSDPGIKLFNVNVRACCDYIENDFISNGGRNCYHFPDKIDDRMHGVIEIENNIDK